MKITWVVVAHRSGARILRHEKPATGLVPMAELEHDAGRLRSREIDTDRPGMAFSRVGHGGGHPMATQESPHDHTAAEFARALAARLEDGRNANQFGQLVLVAEPRFLGLLRGALDSVTATLVIGTVGKDLVHVELRDLAPHLQHLLLL